MLNYKAFFLSFFFLPLITTMQRGASSLYFRRGTEEILLVQQEPARAPHFCMLIPAPGGFPGPPLPAAPTFQTP